MPAKRRDRRTTPSSDSRQVREDEAKQNRVDQISESTESSDPRLIAIFVFFFVIVPAVSVLVYAIKYRPNTVRFDDNEPEQGRVKVDLDYKEVIDEHLKVSENDSQKHYSYPVLAYITPWNSKGYEMAKRFANKFTHFSPVWYDLKSQGTGLTLEGRHNADMGWISEIRALGDALLLPRVVLEAFPRELLRKEKMRDQAIELILLECKDMDYDGIVLESWSRWAAYGVLHDPDLRNKALLFIKQLGYALHSVSSARSTQKHLELVYVIGPPYSETLQAYDFGPQDLQSLRNAVDGFSLMTYDFSNSQRPGPNAPLHWIRLVLQILLGTSKDDSQKLATKIFLGINFYGNDFALSEGSEGGAVTGRDYLSLLEKHKPKLQWEKNSKEHFFLYVDDNGIKHAVFYPTLMSISVRLEEAWKWGTGISVWEIGQGLDYFFDLP